ncbi:hypothetical protein [Nonomuraea sp. NPDC050643]|uniref:hypothetical protein n=1 Tax=Nonomuraea sp. NPDC050643 TaxID=3155660 RepID=UPI0033C3A8ED
MSTDLERSLASEFARAAGHAPGPRGDLRARIEEGHRVRRRRFVALYAAGVVVVLSASVPLAVDALTAEPPAATDPSPEPTGRPRYRPADKSYPPIEKVWPGAVHVIPKKLPNGRAFRPELFLDDDTVLATTLEDGHADRLDGLWAYDLTSRTARRLVQITPPPKTVVTASFISAGGGRLAWWTVRKQDRKRIVDIWAAPASGGARYKVTSFEGVPRFGGIDMQIVGDKAVWSRWGKGGLRQVPLTGGKVETVPGSTGHTLLTWPWAGSPAASSGQFNKVAFGTLANLQTGQVIGAKVRRGSTCHVTWCLWDRTATRRDGTGERPVPGDANTNFSRIPALDRFLALSQAGERGRQGGQVLYDLTTGRAGDLGLRPDERGGPGSASLDYRSTGLFTYERDGKQVVVNLAAIK